MPHGVRIQKSSKRFTGEQRRQNRTPAMWASNGGNPLPVEGVNMNTQLLLATLIALTFAASAQPASADDGPPPWGPIVGTWEATVTPVNCQTGDQFPQFATLTYVTFAMGGTVVETTAGQRFQPGQRAPGQGYWEYTGHKTYFAHYQAFVLFDSVDPVPPATQHERGSQTFDHSIEVLDADHWTGDSLVTFRDVAGEPVPPSGCAKTTAVRMR